jgi:hypothetical protein
MSLVLKVILGGLLNAPAGSDWKQLDENMRTRLKVVATLNATVMLVLLIPTVWIFCGLQRLTGSSPGVAGLLAFLQTLNSSVPSLVPKIAEAVYVVLCYFLVGLLIDASRFHYVLDQHSFQLLAKSRDAIVQSVHRCSPCRSGPGCAIDALLETSNGPRHFMRNFFYHFANRDSIGAWSQSDKRREVFAAWAEYYTVNIVLPSLVIIFSGLAIIVSGEALVPGSYNAFFMVPAIGFLLWWLHLGHRYGEKVTRLAADQIEAFFNYARTQSIQQLRRVVGRCGNANCRI